MDSRKRTIAVALIVLVILFSVWVSRSGIQKGKLPVEQTAVKEHAGEMVPAPIKTEETKAPEAPPAIVAQEAQLEETAPPVLPAAAGEKCSPDAPAVVKKRSAAAPKGMLYVPGGSFTMGTPAAAQDDDSSPARQVCVSGFYLDALEVTNTQFKEFVDATNYVTDAEKSGAPNSPSWRHPSAESNSDEIPNHPVVCVSYNDANAYARWARKRLPTEAEWEKAARGTDGRAFPWGNSKPTNATLNVADQSASFKWSASIDDGYKGAAPVGSFPAGKSAYGVQDMAGNAWEWCSDWWSADYYKSSPANNPIGPEQGEFRIVRGGSWYHNLDGARTTQRMYFRPEAYSSAIGFRCAADSQ